MRGVGPSGRDLRVRSYLFGAVTKPKLVGDAHGITPLGPSVSGAPGKPNEIRKEIHNGSHS